MYHQKQCQKESMVFSVAVCLCVLVASIDTVLATQCLKHSVARTPYSTKGYREVYERWRETMLGYSRQNRWPTKTRDLYFSIAAQGRAGCGSAYPDFSAIVGGKGATLKAWPWIVLIEFLLQNRGSSRCAGTLLSNEWVLTAAHCMEKKYTALFLLLGTMRNVRGPDSFAFHRGIAAVVIHQLYRNFFNGSAIYDIALLKLDRPVAFSTYVQPACLPDNLTDLTSPFLDCYVAGFGRVQYFPPITTSNLQELKVIHAFHYYQ
ncbi:serine protease [Plakobranchus ocellatus]|uniref:Serine protease n=1 Tax=Plakobranchus ocellatus TaxID=259542 RepID=A0AAV4D3N2_9GAST|nr:serine protease [Plakobranchus ocellatus]